MLWTKIKLELYYFWGKINLLVFRLFYINSSFSIKIFNFRYQINFLGFKYIVIGVYTFFNASSLLFSNWIGHDPFAFDILASYIRKFDDAYLGGNIKQYETEIITDDKITEYKKIIKPSLTKGFMSEDLHEKDRFSHFVYVNGMEFFNVLGNEGTNDFVSCYNYAVEDERIYCKSLNVFFQDSKITYLDTDIAKFLEVDRNNSLRSWCNFYSMCDKLPEHLRDQIQVKPGFSFAEIKLKYQISEDHPFIRPFLEINKDKNWYSNNIVHETRWNILGFLEGNTPFFSEEIVYTRRSFYSDWQEHHKQKIIVGDYLSSKSKNPYAVLWEQQHLDKKYLDQKHWKNFQKENNLTITPVQPADPFDLSANENRLSVRPSSPYDPRAREEQFSPERRKNKLD